VYGATKAALPQLMKSLVKETAGTNVPQPVPLVVVFVFVFLFSFARLALS
jgi:hypothetical protein